MVKQPQQSYGRARVNHIHAKDAQTASGVVLGEFLVNSVLAIVLFDYRASHSFISSSFAEKHKIPIVLLKLPLITRTPGFDIKCHLGFLNVKIILSGVVFLTDLIVLKSKGIDVILGMDWLTRHNRVISCATKKVSLVNQEGIKGKCQTRRYKVNPMVFNLDAMTIKEVPVVQQYPDVFPEELPGMPPDRDIEFIIDLIPGTAPIAKRPYRMALAELAELKKQLRELQ
jgi:hypothetical protein